MWLLYWVDHQGHGFYNRCIKCVLRSLESSWKWTTTCLYLETSKGPCHRLSWWFQGVFRIVSLFALEVSCWNPWAWAVTSTNPWNRWNPRPRGFKRHLDGRSCLRQELTVNCWEATGMPGALEAMPDTEAITVGCMGPWNWEWDHEKGQDMPRPKVKIRETRHGGSALSMPPCSLQHQEPLWRWFLGAEWQVELAFPFIREGYLLMGKLSRPVKSEAVSDVPPSWAKLNLQTAN